MPIRRPAKKAAKKAAKKVVKKAPKKAVKKAVTALPHETLMRQQAALLRLGAAIASAEGEHEICRAVVLGLHDASLDFDFLALLLVDASTGERVLVASAGKASAQVGLRIKPGSGLSERPLLDGQLHYTPQVTKATPL